MKHTIMIPDWVWEYWQGVTGGTKPASRIREELIKVTLEHRIKNEIKVTLEQHQMELASSDTSILPDPINYDGSIDFDVDDSPTAIVIERIGVCRYCERIMQKGEEAFWFSERGRKYLAHPGCWSDAREIP